MVFVPHTPRHFDSHLGRWSIYHCPGTKNLFTLLHQGFQLGCSGACIQVWVCVCVHREDTQLSSFLSTGFLYPEDPCAHVHKCSLAGSSSLMYLSLYVSVSVHGDVNVTNALHFPEQKSLCAHVAMYVCPCTYTFGVHRHVHKNTYKSTNEVQLHLWVCRLILLKPRRGYSCTRRACMQGDEQVWIPVHPNGTVCLALCV